MRVLVVEDEFVQRRDIAVALAAAGYETRDDGRDFLASWIVARHTDRATACSFVKIAFTSQCCAAEDMAAEIP